MRKIVRILAGMAIGFCALKFVLAGQLTTGLWIFGFISLIAFLGTFSSGTGYHSGGFSGGVGDSSGGDCGGGGD